MPAREREANNVERRPVSDAERTRIALARYAEMRTKGKGKKEKGKLVPIARLAERFGRDRSVITRAIAEAFRRGLVAVTPAHEERPSFVLDRGAAETLRDEFADLQAAIVVKSEPGADSIETHRLLGCAMADYISSAPILRNKDRLGVGSGRAVYACVEALGSLPPFRPQDVTILSLTGSLRARHSNPRINLHVDADVHLALLGLCFEHPIRLEPISHSIATEPPDRARIVEGTWLGDGSLVPTHALVGVGVLATGHRLYDLVKAPQDQQASKFDPALLHHLPTLPALVELCDEYQECAGEALVGDLANCLFVIEPSPGSRALQDRSGRVAVIRKDAARHVAELNRHLVTAQMDIFKQIGSIMVISGTREKAAALFTLLSGRDLPRIHYLCTDSQAAAQLTAWRRLVAENGKA